MNLIKQDRIHRVNKVIDYIDNNLSNELNIDILARVAHFSNYHFHRIFKETTGENLNQYIKRVRLERAASMLVRYKIVSIAQVAEHCGFKSNSVFCRNFKAHFGVSAIDYRNNFVSLHGKNGQLKSKNSQFSNESCRYFCPDQNEDSQPMIIREEIRVEHLAEKHIIYCRHIGSVHEVNQAFEKLYRWAEPRQLLSDNAKTVVVYHDNIEITEMEKFRQSVGIIVDGFVKTEGEIGCMSIKAGSYMVGKFDIYNNFYCPAWQAVFEAMANKGYHMGDAFPFKLQDTPILGNNDDRASIEICIPVALNYSMDN